MKFFYLKFGLFFIICLFLVINGQAQDKAKENYLLIRFESSFDNTNQRLYYYIVAEKGCDEASAVYSLVKYDNKKNATNKAGVFYLNTKNVTDSLYNYFLSPTEGLNFMAAMQWQLLSVTTEIFSSSKNERSGSENLVPITTVTSRPVFCFKR
jgi:hypothetical protein